MQAAVLPHHRTRFDFEPVELSIVTGGTARLTRPELAMIRKESLHSFAANLSPQLLTTSDERTLASLVGLADAIESTSVTDVGLHRWAIVSSSRILGRSTFGAVIDQDRRERPWGVSVEVIPHCAAHAVGGTINLALESLGPCICAGDGVVGEIDAFVSAACIHRRPDWFGAWIVFSARSPELVIDTSDRLTPDSSCFAAAIAVTRDWSACSLGRIGRHTSRPTQTERPDETPTNLSARFIDFLTGPRSSRTIWTGKDDEAVSIHAEFVPRQGGEPVQMRFAPEQNLFQSDDFLGSCVGFDSFVAGGIV